MSVVTLREKRIRARKVHRCASCLGTIEVGTSYLLQVNVDGSEFWEYRSHETCDRIARALRREMGLIEDEWPEPSDVQNAMRRIINTLSK